MRKIKANTMKRWALIVENYKQSGLKQAEFCAQFGVSLAVLSRALAQSRKIKSHASEFCEAVIAEPKNAHNFNENNFICIRNSRDFCVEIPLNITPAIITEILRGIL